MIAQSTKYTTQPLWTPTENGGFKRAHNTYFSEKQKEDAKRKIELQKAEEEQRKKLERQLVDIPAYIANQRRKKIESESLFLTKALMRVYEDLSPFDLLIQSKSLLAREEEHEQQEYDSIVRIYGNHARQEVSKEETQIITDNALRVIQGIAEARVDQKCGELVHHDIQKTLRYY